MVTGRSEVFSEPDFSNNNKVIFLDMTSNISYIFARTDHALMMHNEDDVVSQICRFDISLTGVRLSSCWEDSMRTYVLSGRWPITVGIPC